ncbi:MAG: hypothetical protein Q8J78_15995, partial [Moraxellaceae bacterium]|nr:hypothetical protein [Moraxellaceae bacterium]
RKYAMSLKAPITLYLSYLDSNYHVATFFSIFTAFTRPDMDTLRSNNQSGGGHFNQILLAIIQ